MGVLSQYQRCFLVVFFVLSLSIRPCPADMVEVEGVDVVGLEGMVVVVFFGFSCSWAEGCLE